MGRPAQRRRGGSGQEDHRGTALLPEQPAGGSGDLRPGRARPLGGRSQLHWALDVVFDEDQSRVHTGHAVANLGRLCRDHTRQRGAKGKQFNADLKPDYPLHLLEDTPIRLTHQPCWQANRHPPYQPISSISASSPSLLPFLPPPKLQAENRWTGAVFRYLRSHRVNKNPLAYSKAN